jgi:hypothetical protein
MKYALSAISAGFLAALLAAPPAFSQGGERPGAPAATTSSLEVAYDLYAGGISFGHAVMSARVEGGDYKAISTLETKGIVNAFWQSKIETSSSGKLTPGKLQPVVYDSFSQNKSTPRREVVLTFGPDGPKSIVSNPPYPDDKYPVSGELRKNTLDPLSASLFLVTNLASTGAKDCSGVAPIFDGRRRYDVGISFVKNSAIRMDNGLYAGPAQVCQVRYRQIAGYSQEVIEKNKKFPDIFAWVVAFKGTADPGRAYMVPVRIWAQTDYGIIAAVVSQLKLDGAPFGGTR